MKIKFLALPIVLIAIFIGYFGMLCGVDAGCALAPYIHSFTFEFFKPLWVYGLFSLPVPIVLMFVRDNVWKIWLRLAAWWLPLSIIAIAITPTWSSSWFSLFSFVKEDFAMIMASLFTAISLILIVWKQFNLGKRLT